MVLMRNRYLSLDNIEFNGKYVKNMTDLILLPDIIEKYLKKEYISTLRLEENRYLEGISFEVYGTTDYWDILMLVNDMTRMDSLPQSYDVVLKKAQERLMEWKSLATLTRGALYPKLIEEKYKEFLSIEEQNNEKYRDIKYVDPKYISEFLAELDALVGVPKIDSNLIINKDDIKET